MARPDLMGGRQSFQVTGESWRASGYGDPAGQYLPIPGPFACVLLGVPVPGLVHASRMAAALGRASEVTADRLRNSLLLIPPCEAGRSLGCRAMPSTPFHRVEGSGHPLTGE